MVAICYWICFLIFDEKTKSQLSLSVMTIEVVISKQQRFMKYGTQQTGTRGVGETLHNNNRFHFSSNNFPPLLRTLYGSTLRPEGAGTCALGLDASTVSLSSSATPSERSWSFMDVT